MNLKTYEEMNAEQQMAYDIGVATFKASLTSPETIKGFALKEWEENLALDRLVIPNGWDNDLWLNYLADRTVYIFRQVLRSVEEGKT